MSAIKYVQRLERMNWLIQRRATGNSHEFARKMGLCRSVLLETIKDMKSLGAPISYCRFDETYYYSEYGSLSFNFLKESEFSNK